MNQNSSTEKRAVVFEDTLATLINEFSDNRILNAYCSEADIRAHLIHKLFSILPARDVHEELPIPLDVERFSNELWGRARIASRRCIKADIAIIDSENLQPQIIAELKFTPLYWGFMPLVEVSRSQDEKFRRIMKESLQRDLGFLQRLRASKPSQKEVERNYFGSHKNEPTTVEKMILIINDFKTKVKSDVRAYLCVFDEFYPNIQDILEEAIDRYAPPDNFKIISVNFDIAEALQDTLTELDKGTSETPSTKSYIT